MLPKVKTFIQIFPGIYVSSQRQTFIASYITRIHLFLLYGLNWFQACLLHFDNVSCLKTSSYLYSTEQKKLKFKTWVALKELKPDNLIEVSGVTPIYNLLNLLFWIFKTFCKIFTSINKFSQIDSHRSEMIWIDFRRLESNWVSCLFENFQDFPVNSTNLSGHSLKIIFWLVDFFQKYTLLGGHS